MIVADASALASLGAARALGAFDVHTTALVVESLEAGSAFHGETGDGAREVLAFRDRLTVHRGAPFESSRVTPSEGSCATLAVELGADVLLTDDLLAIPELDRSVPCPVATSSFVLVALVRRGVLDRQDALFRLETLVGTRGWLGRTVNRRVVASLDEATG